MRRREFFALVGLAAAGPWNVRAQQREPRRVGVLMPFAESNVQAQAFVSTFREELQKSGWIEGQNIRVDIRWATSDAASIERFGKELVALRPDLILASATPATASLLQQTRTIPIVFTQVADPVGSGFVASLPRPGGNATGFINLEASMGGKWLELLKEIAPHVSRAAFLFNPETAPYADFFLNSFKAAAATFAVTAIGAPVRDASQLEKVIVEQSTEPNSGLIIMPDAFTAAHREQIPSFAARYRLPSVYPFRFFTQLGGLISYGNDAQDNFRRAATYADRILRGEKPADLPVQAPVKFELVINLKTAQALGLTVPSTLLARAEEVIQ
jgi:putative ABC transport system substrate-binding protein